MKDFHVEIVIKLKVQMNTIDKSIFFSSETISKSRQKPKDG